VSGTPPENGPVPEQHHGPTTLAQAHDVLSRQRPAPGAGPREWVAFHRHSASVYSQTAAIDRRHHHEALQCAGLEIRKARDIEHQLDPQADDEEF
jgi:hypothetical protein